MRKIARLGLMAFALALPALAGQAPPSAASTPLPAGSAGAAGEPIVSSDVRQRAAPATAPSVQPPADAGVGAPSPAASSAPPASATSH
ncbi:MAG: hypothetical protein JSS21_06480 [Proteobacteria bacterium]|nr:hypothetical protein [Pseudomonadota bacterium]